MMMRSMFFLLAILFACVSLTSAQVFDADPGAGAAQQYYGNWGPNADAGNPAGVSYNNYRKAFNFPAGDLIMASSEPDGETGTFTNIRNDGGQKAPGLFFGNSASASSYTGARFFFGAVTDPGNGALGDTQGRRSWDFRLGFTESPSAWLAGKAPNSGEMDLWTGDHGSDTVYFQGFTGATDDASMTPATDPVDGTTSVNNTNQYVKINQYLLGQSGSDGTIGNEQGRLNWDFDPDPMNRTAVGIWEPGNVSVAGVEDPDERQWLDHYDTGVAYGDQLFADWGMELNDPGNADPVLARQVKFSATFGDVVMEQVFDPGAPGSAVEPNQNGFAFQGDFFDWQNAFPVIFLNAGGTTGASGNATAQVGFVNDAPVTCDFNGDTFCDGADVDALTAEIVDVKNGGNADLAFDLNGDNTVDNGDLNQWLVDAGAANPGATGGNPFLGADSNLDGSVNGQDFVDWNTHKFTSNSDFTAGDWNADGDVNGQDFVIWNNLKFTSSSDGASAVPEPRSGFVVLVGFLAIRLLRRRG